MMPILELLQREKNCFYCKSFEQIQRLKAVVKTMLDPESGGQSFPYDRYIWIFRSAVRKKQIKETAKLQ